MVLEVLEEPGNDSLYFWALQVDFLSAGLVWGTAHTGLQWNRRYPGSRAVNWGGYASGNEGGTILPGTTSSLRGFPDDPNTLAYPWQAGRPYRLRVLRSPDIPGAWRAEVTDLTAQASVTIRDLMRPSGHEAPDSYLVRPLVWSEIFADCDAPSVTVRWSRFQAVDSAGAVLAPEALTVNYQSQWEGGCSNTSVALDSDGGVLQMTTVPRTVPQGTRLLIGNAALPTQKIESSA